MLLGWSRGPPPPGRRWAARPFLSLPSSAVPAGRNGTRRNPQAAADPAAPRCRRYRPPPAPPAAAGPARPQAPSPPPGLPRQAPAGPRRPPTGSSPWGAASLASLRLVAAGRRRLPPAGRRRGGAGGGGVRRGGPGSLGSCAAAAGGRIGVSFTSPSSASGCSSAASSRRDPPAPPAPLRPAPPPSRASQVPAWASTDPAGGRGGGRGSPQGERAAGWRAGLAAARGRGRRGWRALSPAAPAPMAIPPSYVDLGKSARDIFNKGYGFGLVKLDVKTKSASGVEFTTSGSSNTDTGKVNGSLETKYKWAEYGLTFTEKWNTDNTLGTEIAIEDQIAKGLKLTFDTTFSPNTGKKSGKIKSAYKRECLNLGCDVDFDFAGPAIHGSAVFGYEGWLAGYQMTFDSAKSKLTRNNFSVGYKTGDFQLHTNVNDGSEFGGSIYQKVSDNLETAVNLAWTAGSNSTRFGIAAKYKLDSTASISAKVNNSSLVGVGYTQTLRPGVKLTLSALIDGKSINAGGHKLGLGLELEA
ncbi:non-selective voltage-gated ion channel VDAC2 isoform 2-T2 [Alca torda]